MKKITNKILILGIIISIFLAIISIPSFAKTETKTIVLKKADDKYLIYFDEICNNVFKFAISNDKNTKQEDLKFIASAIPIYIVIISYFKLEKMEEIKSFLPFSFLKIKKLMRVDSKSYNILAVKMLLDNWCIKITV